LESLLAQVGTSAPAPVIRAVADDVKRYADGVAQSDDITTLAVQYRG